ncbi:MAG: glycosyltransferase 87 family protein [Phycisphaerae bacterium]|nr:glycosyltransferase 87 family protein [Phycisphaerae bacterium]MDW8261039.1 glycosyltransferase 87 family protein [Phycisphaerales bacterium]
MWSDSRPILSLRSTRLLLAVIAVGLAARFALLSISIGSLDAVIWQRLAEKVVTHGLYETYRQDIWMNHPPVSALWAAWVWRAAEASGLNFAQLYKLPVVIADCATCLLIYLSWQARAGQLVALQAAALYAWNVDAILISAHHCNSDPVYSMLSLLALWLLEIRRAPLLAGLALGAAINIKLIPALLLAPFLLLPRSRAELVRVLVGLGLMAVPCVYVWLELGKTFQKRVIGYDSAPTGWGFHHLIDQLSNHPLLKSYLDTVAERYRRSAALLVMAVAAWAVLRLRRREKGADRIDASAAAAACYAAVTPALAPQHTVFIGVLLFASDPRSGAHWGLLSGAWAIVYYFFAWDGSFPLAPAAAAYGPAPTGMLTTIAWLWVLVEAWRRCFRRPST